jgi:hypothetical protein
VRSLLLLQVARFFNNLNTSYHLKIQAFETFFKAAGLDNNVLSKKLESPCVLSWLGSPFAHLASVV